MKQLKLLFLFVIIATFSTQAQPGGGQRRTPEERTKMVIERMADSLKISAVQQKDLSDIYMNFYKGQDQLRDALQPGERPKREDLERLSTDRDAKLKAVLTEEQFNKFKAMEAAMRQRQGQRPAGQ